MTMTQGDEQLEVRNGGRTTSFTGRLIARVSSERAHAPRWTVMELYRTVRGFYVIHRIGASKVFHSSDCEQARANGLPYGHEMPEGAPSQADLSNMRPCITCRPVMSDNPTTLRFERERHWAGVAETPEAAVDMLHRTDNGQRSLPWIAANLLNDAAKGDPLIAQAFATERI